MKTPFRNVLTVLLAVVLLLTACKNSSTTSDNLSLPRGVPEEEGVSSEDIMTFLDAAAASGIEYHSFMLLRHGKVIAEGWWNPYKPEYRHTMYSASKSFTSTAIGFAVSENLLTVNDKVISFFPDELPAEVSPNLADMEVRDLLSMTAGQDPDPTFLIPPHDSNWVKAFLALPVLNDPGTKFLYNSMATYMLSAIVQKVTGEKVVDYLTPRLFEPLGIQGMDWEVDPMGINSGGWGLRIKTEDMAKFGQLYLQKGDWNGQQIIPAAWIEEASSSKIDQSPEATQAARDSSDWLQGYCYQFWRCRNNGFRADGAFGQFIIVLPDKDAVVVFTTETSKTQEELYLVWDYLLPAMKDEKLPENTGAEEQLKTKLAALALPLPQKDANIDASATEGSIQDKSFTIDANDRNIEEISFHFMEGMCHMSITINSKEYPLTFGDDHWISSVTAKPGPNLLNRALAHFEVMPTSVVAGSFAWTDANTLAMVHRYVESAHHEVFTCTFDKDKVAMDILTSYMPDAKVPVITGTLIK